MLPAAHLLALFESAPLFHFGVPEQSSIAGSVLDRLLWASLLGAAVGLEGEWRRKASGIRTNLLICLGCAFFTLLSAVLAGDGNPDKGRVASNIVQGIGFLGAGLILHRRKRVSGLTSAAGVFVVAAIGMACGAGLYRPALMATAIVIAAMELVGQAERRLSLKLYYLNYEARGSDLAGMQQAILRQMDEAGIRYAGSSHDSIGALERVSFYAGATMRAHRMLEGRLRQEPAISRLLTFRNAEED